jgi:putative ABC transport system ATP-binding protein
VSGAVLRGEGLVRRHGDTTVLAGLSLEVSPGEWLALLGPSGAGKTTLLQVLGLLDRPNQGRVLIAGEDAWALGAAERTRLRLEHIGFVFQQHNLLGHLTALENVARPAWRRHGASGPALREAQALLERLGLSPRSRLLAGLLSAGEAERVAVARALVNRPQVVLADEPTGSLDSASAEKVLVALGEVHAAGVALIMVTHDAGVAARAERRLLLEDGVLKDAGA